MNLIAMAKPIVVAAIAGFAVTCALGEPAPATAPAESVRVDDKGNRVVAQMLTAHYQGHPSIAQFEAGARSDPATRLQRCVALRDWPAVASELALISPGDAARVHLRIVSSLLEETPRTQRGSSTAPASSLAPADVVDLINGLPEGAAFATVHQVQVGRLLGKTLSGAVVPREIVERLVAGRIGRGTTEHKLQAATILAAAGQAAVARELFGDGRGAIESGDPEIAELFVRTMIALAVSDTHPKPTRAQLADLIHLLGSVADRQPVAVRRQYISLAIEIASSVGAPDLLDTWLKSALTQPAAARDLLLVVSSANAESDAPWQRRAQRLAVQSHIVETWIRGGGKTGTECPPAFFDVLVENFLFEAALGDAPPPQPRGQDPRMQNQNAPRGPEAIPAGNLLDVVPSPQWQAELSPTTACRLKLELVKLQLRLDRIGEAVALLDAPPQLSADQAAFAGHVLLQAWTKLNSRSMERILGNASRLIALTISDSARQRHVTELSQLAAKLRSIDPAMVPADDLVLAFTNTLGRAPIISQQDVEDVFGPVEKMDSVAALKLSDALQRMVQQSITALTKKDNSGVAEIGQYRSGFQLIERILQAQVVNTDNEQTRLRLATVQFVHAEFCRTSAKDVSRWLELRQAAFESFKRAAERHNSSRAQDDFGVPDLTVFLQWFICAMGETESSQIGGDSVPEPRQLPLLQQAVQSLPASARSDFARLLSAQALRVRPEAAQPFVSAALSVAGDIPGAEPLVRSSTYYQDILSEMKLILTLDGDANVGVGEPFGVKVELLHTEQLDREVGGFSRLIFTGQNAPTPPAGVAQPSGLRGRVASRERFEAYLHSALAEKFEIVHILWSDGKTQVPLKGTPGWQQLSLAYLLLKAKDASADLLPAAQLVMDFGDRNAAENVLLAVDSASFPLNAKQASERPYSLSEVTQTLNDREADEGKLSLEINAKGDGLIPPLDRILNLSDLGDFIVADVTDRGLMADQLAADVNQGTDRIQTQRTWAVTLQPKAANALSFQFPHIVETVVSRGPLVPKLLRYSDTDIVAAEQRVRISGSGITRLRYGGWLWAVAAGGLALIAVVIWRLVHSRRIPVPDTHSGVPVPSQLTLFSTIRYLQALRERISPNLNEEVLKELDAAALRLQVNYSQNSAQPPSQTELSNLLSRWEKEGARRISGN